MSDERRYYGLDALRGSMMLMGVVLHSAAFYIAAPPPHLPVALDQNRSVVMDGIVTLIHAFRMPTFFVVAGFFAALLVEKRGLMDAYRNRLARIGAPLLASMFTILPVTLFFVLDFAIFVRLGKFQFLPEIADLQQMRADSIERGLPQGAPWMHLWFLAYLLYFYLLIPFCRMLVRWSLPIEAPLGRFLASPWALVVFSLYTAATLWPYPGAAVFGNFLFIGFDPPAALYYGSFFVIGYVYHHYRASTAVLVDYVPWCATLACLLFPVSAYLSHLEFAHPGNLENHVMAVIANGFCTWALIWLLVGIALRFFDRPTAWALYTSQSSYWVYLLHLPVCALMGWLLAPVDVSALVKFALVCTVTTLVCFTTYHYWVQDSWLGAFLNGKRFRQDWPWRKAATKGDARAVST